MYRLYESYINRFSEVRILCVGDVMLDNFLYGAVERISPEAPVPIFKKLKSVDMLGGAGNVALNLKSLGAKVSLIGAIGCDLNGERVRDLLKSACITNFLLCAKGFPTITKTRLIASNNHLLRMDEERLFEFTDSEYEELKKYIEQVVRDFDIIILSDYGKGLFSPKFTHDTIATCTNAGKMVVVDPKGSDYSKYDGSTLIKPNLKEFELMSGLKTSFESPDFFDKLKLGADKLFDNTKINGLLVTLSEHGMAYISADNRNRVFHIPTQQQKIYDVSGAGDTSLAMLGMCMGLGMDIENSIYLSNIASGIVVGKLGTATVSPKELIDAIRAKSYTNNASSKPENKILSVEETKVKVDELKKCGVLIGITNGCFDMLHLGHLHSFSQAKKECDFLIVAVNSDRSIKRLKGESRPIQDEKTRAGVLAALEVIDAVTIFDDDTALPLVKLLRPDVIAKEGYCMDSWPEAQFVTAYGGKAVTIDRLEGYSTTSTLAKIKYPPSPVK